MHSQMVTRPEAARRLTLRAHALLGVALWSGLVLLLLVLSAHG